MPIELYSLENLNSIGDAAVKINLPELDPSVPGSFIRTLVASEAILVFAAQRNIQAALDDFFPQTAEGQFLDFWAEINALTRVPGTVAEGRITIVSQLPPPGPSIPLGTIFASTNNDVYISTASVDPVVHSGSVTLSRVGTLITAVTPVDHALVTGLLVEIDNTPDPAYSGTFVVTVLSSLSFQYTALSTPGDPTNTGTYDSNSEFADVPIVSVAIGVDKNLAVGAVLTMQDVVIGWDAGTPGTVNRDGITGGSDIESDASLRERVLLANSIDAGVFTNAQVRLDALTIPTATRVFITNPSINFTTDGTDVVDRGVDGATFSGGTVTLDMTANGTDNVYVGSTITVADAVETEYNGDHTVVTVTSTSITYAISGTPSTPATGTILLSLDKLKNIPQPGTVYVFVLDDGNSPPTPGSTTITNVKAKIIEKLPAHSTEDSVVVTGPFFESVDIDISSLSPDSSSMRSAIENSLAGFFADAIGFTEDIKLNQIIAAIQNTQDSETGEFVDDFSLDAPTADVAVGGGTLGDLGTVTFA